MPEVPSFIPKTIPTKSDAPKRRVSIIFVAAAAIFVGVLAVFGGVFLYNRYLNQQITDLSTELVNLKGEFEPSLIRELALTGESIDAAKKILGAHVSISRVFDFIEENTLPTTRFGNFNYQGGQVTMNGTAASYRSLAEQSLLFEQSGVVDDIVISNLSLAEGGRVNFSLVLTLDPGLITYQAP